MYGSFYGWYFKCQSRTQTLAVIPAVHKAGRKRTCSVQIITDNDAWTTAFPADAFHGERKKYFHRREPVRGRGDSVGDTHTGAVRKGQTGFWTTFSLKI